jgi:hypothetical protein
MNLCQKFFKWLYLFLFTDTWLSYLHFTFSSGHSDALFLSSRMALGSTGIKVFVSFPRI